jgi:hypothetical protein
MTQTQEVEIYFDGNEWISTSTTFMILTSFVTVATALGETILKSISGYETPFESSKPKEEVEKLLVQSVQAAGDPNVSITYFFIYHVLSLEPEADDEAINSRPIYYEQTGLPNTLNELRITP